MKISVFILFSMLFISQLTIAQTTRINTFDQLMESLNTGEQVRVVIHYALCKWATDKIEQKPTPNAITGMDIDTYEYFAPGVVYNKEAFMVFSDTKLIQNPIGKGMVYNYGKIRIYADNSVQVTAEYLNPKSYKVLMHQVFKGKINEGINIFKQ